LSRIVKSAVLQNVPLVIKYHPDPLAAATLAPEIKPPLQVSEEIISARKTAVDIIARAEAEAAQLLDNARQEASAIKAAAEAKAETICREAAEIREAAQREGYQAGYEQGYEQGYAAGLEKGRQEARDAMNEEILAAANKAQQTIALAQETARQMIIDAEGDIIRIAVAAVRKILAREIAENPLVVLPIVKTALEKVRDQNEVNIRVSPNDYDLVLQARHDLQAMVGRSQAITVTCDASLQPGDCLIETNYGTVDARIESQLENLKQALQEVLPS